MKPGEEKKGALAMRGVNLSMTSDRDAETTEGERIPSGTEVTYVAHVVRAVKVRLADGREVIVNPNVFPRLR